MAAGAAVAAAGGLAIGALAADGTTGIGVADDVFIPVTAGIATRGGVMVATGWGILFSGF